MSRYRESYKKFKKRLKDKVKIQQIKATAESAWKLTEEYKRFVKNM